MRSCGRISRHPLFWSLLVLVSAQALGVFVFMSGFFLNRYELPDVSTCSLSDLVAATIDIVSPTSPESVLPTDGELGGARSRSGSLFGTPVLDALAGVEPREPASEGSDESSRASRSHCEGCWGPRMFDQVIIAVVDALRFDFLLYNTSLAREGEGNTTAVPPLPWQNKLPSLSLAPSASPGRARLYRFLADAPTVTAQRLKGLTTGGLPTFLEVRSNWQSSAIEEDSWPKQAKARGKRVFFVGDDTWESLFPEHFTESHPYPSFDVADLDTVDKGCDGGLTLALCGEGGDVQGIPGEDSLHSGDVRALGRGGAAQWDVILSHELGVDHAGHKHGPQHPEMARKLGEADARLGRLVELVNARAKDSAAFAASAAGAGVGPGAGAGGAAWSMGLAEAAWRARHCASQVKPRRTMTRDEAVPLQPLLPPPRTLLVVLGDHGMTAGGNHGGASDEETHAGLFALSSVPLMPATGAGEGSGGGGKRHRHLYWEKEHDHTHTASHEGSKEDNRQDEGDVLGSGAGAVPQIDLVPTLSMLLGLPVPFGSLGKPIPSLLPLHSRLHYRAHHGAQSPSGAPPIPLPLCALLPALQAPTAPFPLPDTLAQSNSTALLQLHSGAVAAAALVRSLYAHRLTTLQTIRYSRAYARAAPSFPGPHARAGPVARRLLQRARDGVDGVVERVAGVCSRLEKKRKGDEREVEAEYDEIHDFIASGSWAASLRALEGDWAHWHADLASSFRREWTQFDLPGMGAGIALLVGLAVVSVAAAIAALGGDGSSSSRAKTVAVITVVTAAIAAAAVAAAKAAIPAAAAALEDSSLTPMLAGALAATVAITAATAASYQSPENASVQNEGEDVPLLPTHPNALRAATTKRDVMWACVPVVLIALAAAHGQFSNSLIISEHLQMRFLAATASLIAVVAAAAWFSPDATPGSQSVATGPRRHGQRRWLLGLVCGACACVLLGSVEREALSWGRATLPFTGMTMGTALKSWGDALQWKSFAWNADAAVGTETVSTHAEWEVGEEESRARMGGLTSKNGVAMAVVPRGDHSHAHSHDHDPSDHSEKPHDHGEGEALPERSTAAAAAAGGGDGQWVVALTASFSPLLKLDGSHLITSTASLEGGEQGRSDGLSAFHAVCILTVLSVAAFVAATVPLNTLPPSHFSPVPRFLLSAAAAAIGAAWVLTVTSWAPTAAAAAVSKGMELLPGPALGAIEGAIGWQRGLSAAIKRFTPPSAAVLLVFAAACLSLAPSFPPTSASTSARARAACLWVLVLGALTSLLIGPVGSVAVAGAGGLWAGLARVPIGDVAPSKDEAAGAVADEPAAVNDNHPDSSLSHSPSLAAPPLPPVSALARARVLAWAALEACLLWAVGHHVFHGSGHGYSFADLHTAAGFVISDVFFAPLTFAAVAINTLGAHALPPLVLCALWALRIARAHSHLPAHSHLVTVWLGARAGVCTYATLVAVRLAAAAINVTIQRRHLMVWAIFAPKFVLDAAASLAAGVTLALAALVLSLAR